MMPPVADGFALVAIAVGTGMAIGTYMAARRNRDIERAIADGIAQGVAARIAEDRESVHTLITIGKTIERSIINGGEPMGEQLDLEDAIANRDAVLDAVADNNKGWLQLALAAMQQIPDGTVDTGEGFRRRLLDSGLPPPQHANAWGAMTMTLTKRKILLPTGEYRPMLEASSHGRKTPVYTLRHAA